MYRAAVILPWPDTTSSLSSLHPLRIGSPLGTKKTQERWKTVGRRSTLLYRFPHPPRYHCGSSFRTVLEEQTTDYEDQTTNEASDI